AAPPAGETPMSTPPAAVSETPKESAPISAPASRKSGTEYSLQVGAFTTQAAAQAMMSKVRAKDKSYPVATVTLPDSAVKARYRVMVGPYSTLDEANRVMGRLKKDGFDAYLKR